MSRFRPIDRHTDYLLPPSVQDWLPESHLARYVVDVIEGLDLSELERAYAGRGSDAYHPAILLSLLIYGYATGAERVNLFWTVNSEISHFLSVPERPSLGLGN